VVGEIDFGAAEFSDGEAGIGGGGCGGCAHTPQGTPRARTGQGEVCGPRRADVQLRGRGVRSRCVLGVVIRRAVVDAMMTMVMMMRRGKR
jgi:hypothetical protein